MCSNHMGVVISLLPFSYASRVIVAFWSSALMESDGRGGCGDSIRESLLFLLLLALPLSCLEILGPLV